MDPLPFHLPAVILSAEEGSGGILTGRQRQQCCARLQKAAADAADRGADAFCVPTGGLNRGMLSGFFSREELCEVNREYMKTAREALAGRIPAGAAVSKTGLHLPPRGKDRLEEMIDVFKEQTSILKDSGAKFIVIEKMDCLMEARAAAIAIRECCQLPFIAEFVIETEKKTATGSDIGACVTVMRALGASGVVFCPRETDNIAGEFIKISSFLRAPVGLSGVERIPPDMPDMNISVSRAPLPEDLRDIRKSLKPFRDHGEADTEEILVSSIKEAYIIDPVIDITDEIELAPGLLNEILEAEESPYGAIRISVDTDDELEIFNAGQYMITMPLCLGSQSPELFQAAVRVYCGVAIYDHTSEIPAETVEKLKNQYGLKPL